MFFFSQRLSKCIFFHGVFRNGFFFHSVFRNGFFSQRLPKWVCFHKHRRYVKITYFNYFIQIYFLIIFTSGSLYLSQKQFRFSISRENDRQYSNRVMSQYLGKRISMARLEPNSAITYFTVNVLAPWLYPIKSTRMIIFDFSIFFFIFFI